jgi:hypothetical protein
MANFNRQVVQALLHNPIFVPTVGQLNNQIVPVAKGAGKIRDLSMSWGETTLNILVNGVEVGVPHANVQCVTFQADAPSPSKKA